MKASQLSTPESINLHGIFEVERDESDAHRHWQVAAGDEKNDSGSRR